MWSWIQDLRPRTAFSFVEQFNYHDNLNGWMIPDEWEQPDYTEVPLFGRAWRYQERLLSPRILHFTSSHLIFECASEICCECGRISRSDKKLATMRKEYAAAVAAVKAAK